MSTHSRPVAFEIRVDEVLDSRWTDWFEGLQINSDDGNQTVISGVIADQAALFGLLNKICDLGLCLISVQPFDPNSSPNERHS